MRREWASRGSSEEESARKVLQLVAKLQAQQQEITRTGGMGDNSKDNSDSEANKAI